MALFNLDGNPNLKDALRVALALGCTVAPRRRTGEVVVFHPDWARVVVMNNRRKSTPRALMVPLRKLNEEA